MANYYDRDTKVAYVEQINSGKLTVTEAVKELGCSRSVIRRRRTQSSWQRAY